jgi:hypothetical protein
VTFFSLLKTKLGTIMDNKKQIHEYTILLRFLGIIMKFSDLKFLSGFFKPWERPYSFLSNFLLYPLKCTVAKLYKYVRGYMRVARTGSLLLLVKGFLFLTG